jgi:hypothetical protein
MHATLTHLASLILRDARHAGVPLEDTEALVDYALPRISILTDAERTEVLFLLTEVQPAEDTTDSTVSFWS